ncbi:MAG: AAA family ATPase [Candidatus Liptonbacteria bacterium]|nr:AAA family ATPase [Candidatus Liptonbacteria bacterium]
MRGKKEIKIIGITGTLGAGKGTVVEYLKTKGFNHLSVRGFLSEEVAHRGLPVNRDTLVSVANDLRSKHSPGFIAEELYARAVRSGDNCVIESLRTLGEVQALKDRGNFYLFAVDADPLLRYERIVRRGSKTDNVSFEDFLTHEKREMASDDPNKQNLSACIAAADPRFRFLNNGTVFELRTKVDKALRSIKGIA